MCCYVAVFIVKKGIGQFVKISEIQATNYRRMHLMYMFTIDLLPLVNDIETHSTPRVTLIANIFRLFAHFCNLKLASVVKLNLFLYISSDTRGI